MKTLRVLSACCAITLAACGDDAATGENADTGTSDTAETDTSRPEPDVRDDNDAETEVGDVASDTAADATADAGEGSGASDAGDVSSGSGDASSDATPDVEEDTGPPPDAGTDCLSDPTVCELPYTCMGGVCRLSMSGRAFAERDFRIVEPEELTNLFGVLKELASDVRFVALEMEVDPNSDEIFANAGSADLIDGTVVPMQVRWQPLPRNLITFRPYEDDGAPLDGDRWVSDPTFYVIDTIVEVDFGTPQIVRAGFDIEELSILLTLNSASEEATGELTGFVTRAETESRVMIEASAFPTFALLFCRERGYEPLDGLWHMADVLDCNGAVLDSDLDGDTVNDAYAMRIAASFNAAVFVP